MAGLRVLALMICFCGAEFARAQESAAPPDQWFLRGTGKETFATSASAMVERQLRSRGISDQRVLRVMAAVPREKFVPPEVRNSAYEDGPLPIGYGQTIS